MRTKVLRTMLLACLLSLIAMPITASAKTVTKYVQEKATYSYYDASAKKWVKYATSTFTYTSKGVMTKEVFKATSENEDGSKSAIRNVATYKNGKVVRTVRYTDKKVSSTTKYTYKKGVLSSAVTTYADSKDKQKDTYDSKGNIKSSIYYKKGKTPSWQIKYTNTYTKKGVLSKVTSKYSSKDGYNSRNVTTYYTSGAKKGQMKKNVAYSSDGSKAFVQTYSYTLDKNKNISKCVTKVDGEYSDKAVFTYKKIKYKK